MLRSDELLRILSHPIYIYGAGRVGRRALSELKHSGVNVRAFLVTKKENNLSLIEGIPVYAIEEIYLEKKFFIFLAVSDSILKELEQEMQKRGIDRYYRYNIDIAPCLRQKHIADRLSKDYFFDREYAVETGYCGIGRKVQGFMGTFHFRVLLDQNIYGVESFDLLEDFERFYGQYHFLPQGKTANVSKNSYCIAMACCHKDKEILSDCLPWYVTPIQGGKALTARKICDVTDDTGDNISSRNGNYCECSVLYWIWKNGWKKETEYIGLWHYRRKMAIREEQMEVLSASGIDLVLTAPTFVSDIKAHFAVCTQRPEDWEILREGITRVRPEYKDSFEQYERQYMICQCNMFLMRRILFEEYCNFLFPVLAYVEHHYLEREERDDRYLGYLAENLLSVFTIKNKGRLTVAYTDMLLSTSVMPVK